ncbi:MAG TPA: hypothetical protein VN653_02060 [Anaerolineales bacterium]|nr:hypothetical protein [Anaerolineales bacterium]
MNTPKPTLVNVIAWTTLASGIVNLFWGLAATGTVLATIVGIICTPLTILPTILGIFEVIYAAKLFSNPAQPVQPSTNIAVFEIACVLTGNVFAMAVGILSLVFYNDTVVKDYFVRLNGTLAPVTVTPVQPAPIPQPEAAPAIAEATQSEVEEQPAEESPAPPEDTPAKPKRPSRKVAKS